MTMDQRMIGWWKNRPADERFTDLESLHTATLERADRCDVEILSHQALEVVAGEDAAKINVDIMGTKLAPTNWSFGQLCSISGCPAKWARKIHPKLAATNINYGLQFVAERDDTMVLMEHTEEGSMVRSFNAPSYGRIYDHAVVEMTQEVTNGRWKVPSISGANGGSERATTLYASDRDCWIFLVDDTRPIEIRNPRTGMTEVLYRGIIVGNSEVGSKKFFIMMFLYRSICSNRFIYAVDSSIKELGIRHTSGAPERFRREGRKLLQRYAEASVGDVETRMLASMEEPVGTDNESVVKWLRERSFNMREAEGIVKTAEREEGSCRSVWDVVQGGTALARQKQMTDDRVSFEQKVSGLLTRVAA